MEGGRGGREGGLNVQVTQRSNNCGEKAHNGDKIAMHYTGRLKTTGKAIIIIFILFILFWNILSQSSGDFDPPDAHPELKKPPDPSEILIRRNFRKLCISIRTMLISYIKK